MYRYMRRVEFLRYVANAGGKIARNIMKSRCVNCIMKRGGSLIDQVFIFIAFRIERKLHQENFLSRALIDDVFQCTEYR